MSDTAPKSLLPIERLADLMREITVRSKVHVQEAFKGGIKYEPPNPLVSTKGAGWVYQPHPDLYETLATNVLEHYTNYKSDNVDKTYIPAYFFMGGAGTGKSRHASEFASSVQEAIRLDAERHAERHAELHTNDDHCDLCDLYELSQRLKKKIFVFHVSFENGTSLTPEEKSNPWNAIGTRMLHQLLGTPISHIRDKYIADPVTIFELVAAKENVDLYDDFTGILVVDGIHRALEGDDDGKNKNSTFYELLSQISDLSLMSRSSSKAKGRRKAPFIMTCVTANRFGSAKAFLADSHRNRVYLPINRLDPPIWKKDNSPVLNNSAVTSLFVKDVGGHARAIELIAEKLPQNRDESNITDLASAIYARLTNRYSEAVDLLRRYALPIVQCVLSRKKIYLTDRIPGSDLRWEDITASGLIWFEKAKTDHNYNAPGYLVVPYIWLWMLARLPSSENTEHLSKFLKNWEFNDYAELLEHKTGKGFPRYATWQNFEVFCCSFRILRSLGFKDGQEVPLKLLHSGCKLRDDQKTIIVNRHLNSARAIHQCKTDLTAKKDATTHKARSAEDVVTQRSGTLNADNHVILNAPSVRAGDFFLSIETSAQRSPKRKSSQGNIVREVGQCKLVQDKLTQDKYYAERKKSAGPADIFMLYTKTKISDDLALPDRSGLVDASCWDSYFGPFAGRAYMARRDGGSEDVTKT